MTEKEFKERTKQVALRVIRLVETLPNSASPQIIGKQLLHSATSVGANYRAACREKSTADILHKLAIVEESDESLYWLELLGESGIISENKLSVLIKDLTEITAMTVASIKTLRLKKTQQAQKTDSFQQAEQSKIQNPKSKI